MATSEDARNADIGGLLAHADITQKVLDAAIERGIERQAENALVVAQLIEHAAAVVEKLEAGVEQIGRRAEQAAAKIVGEEVRAGLAGADVAVGKAARAALQPLTDAAVANVETVSSAVEALGKKTRSVAILMATGVGALAIFAVAVVALGVWEALGIQRSTIAALETQKTQLQSEIAIMSTNAQTLRDHGLELVINNCGGHLCAAVQPGTQHWGPDLAPFYVLKWQ
jgi:hypothetical protein